MGIVSKEAEPEEENEPTVAALVSNGKRKFSSPSDTGTQWKTFRNNFNKPVANSKKQQERPQSPSQYRKRLPQKDKIPIPTGRDVKYWLQYLH